MDRALARYLAEVPCLGTVGLEIPLRQRRLTRAVTYSESRSSNRRRWYEKPALSTMTSRPRKEKIGNEQSQAHAVGPSRRFKLRTLVHATESHSRLRVIAQTHVLPHDWTLNSLSTQLAERSVTLSSTRLHTKGIRAFIPGNHCSLSSLSAIGTNHCCTGILGRNEQQKAQEILPHPLPHATPTPHDHTRPIWTP